jgi:TPR repeat protein
LLRDGKPEEALAYIQWFIDRGNTRAMLGMADYEYDAGNAQASQAWVRRVEQLVVAGDAEAAIYLVSAYERGLGEGSHEERRLKAIAMLEHAAEHGYVSCAHALMTNYLYGMNGVETSREKFEYWARKAASYGSSAAQEALAKLDRWPHVAPDDQ